MFKLHFRSTLFFPGAGGACMYVTVSVSILQYFDKKKSFANGIAMCGAGISMLKYCI